MTTAMKARAKAAAEAHRPEIELSARVDEVRRDGVVVTPHRDAVRGPDPDWAATFTPREYRSMVRNGSNDAALRTEGWLEPTSSEDFRVESNTPVRLP